MTPWELAKSGTEHAEQRAFFAWANCAELYGFLYAGDKRAYAMLTRDQLQFDGAFGMPRPVPALRWIHAVHNQGHGDAIRGARARAEGVKPGVWDIFWPLPRNHFPVTGGGYCYRHGLYIEMKRSTRVNQDALSPDQKEFLSFAIEAGYQMQVCFSWQEAAQTVERYYNNVAD